MFNPEDVSNWYYNDPTGVTQGPFTGFEMHEWYIAGYFQGDLLVRRETDSSFEPLAHLINRIGDDEKPFLTPPRSSHLKTILTPRSARFNFSNFDSEPDNTFGDFSKSQAYGNFLTSNPLSNNIYNQQSDLHQQSYLNQFSPSMVRNPYDEAAYYKAQQVQQERQLFLQQQMAHPFSSNPYNSMHSGIVANDNQHLYNTHSQSIHQGNVWNNNPSASNQQAYSNPIEKHSQSPTEKEENVSKIAEDKVVAGLNKLNINEEKSKVSPEEGKASTPTNETKVKGNNKAKGSPHNNKQELKEENGNKKVAEKPVKSGLPSTPAPWQGSSKPTKSLREIQLEEEAQMKSRAANQSSEPKRYADTLAKKTTPGWNSVAQQSSTVVKSSSSQR
ncbi:GYF-domain-containing protein [Neoconidiobolus thromboides FSU 785]|nr:GYF-domain-containing protein [Neoconidiobolus thromboides FSU 785]